MQFYVGRQVLDHVSLKDAPGADDDGLEWTDTYASEMTEDSTICTRTGRHRIPCHPGQNQRMGNKGKEAIVQIQKEREMMITSQETVKRRQERQEQRGQI